MLTETSQWAADNTAGRLEADAMIDRMQREGSPLELLRRLDPEACASALEVGFFNRIAERLLLNNT